MTDIKELQERVDTGEICPELGSKADSICNQVRADNVLIERLTTVTIYCKH